MTGRVVSVGSVNLDYSVGVDELVGPGETILARSLTVSPGGKSYNQAAAARLLESEVEFVGAVGDDGAGRTLQADMAELGLLTDRLTVASDVPTGQAFISVDSHGENSIIVAAGANASLEATSEVLEAAACADVLLLALEVPLATVTAVAQHAAAHGTVVVLNPSPFQALPEELVAASHIVIVNEHEVKQLAPEVVIPQAGEGLQPLAETVRAVGLDRCVVTLGAAGAVVLDGDDCSWIDPVPIEAIDTTGAGDAFAGAVGHGIASGQGLADAARFASQVGAYAAAHSGARASYPSRSEVQSWSEVRQ